MFDKNNITTMAKRKILWRWNKKNIKKMGWDKIKLSNHNLVKALREVNKAQTFLKQNRINHGV